VAWAFELTPEGLRRDGEVGGGQSTAPQTAKALNRAIIGGLALIIAAMAVERLWFVPRPVAAAGDTAVPIAEATAIDSIAVWPFQNRSADPDAEYLSDGLAESLVFRLAQLPGLKVAPSSSTIRYKDDRQADPATVAKALGVRAIVSGRLAQRGDELDISVEMIDSQRNTLLWGNRYQRKMPELLATQREIALAIAGKLRPSDASARGVTKRFTNSSEAYRLFLQGRYYFARRGKADIEKGIDYFRQATTLDPQFALAYAGIAEAYTVMPSHAYLAPRSAIPLAKAAAQQALAIDPALAEAHMAMANIMAGYDWQWQAAEEVFKASFALNPNDSTARLRYGQLLAGIGRLQEAIEQLQLAQAIEPLSLNISSNLALVHLYARQHQQGLELAKSTYELDPGFATTLWALGIAYDANGLYADAIRLGEQVLASDPTNQLILMSTGYAYAKSGRRRDAEAMIRRLRSPAPSRYSIAYCTATVYAGLGDKDKAFAELDRSYAQREWWLTRLKVDPLMDSLRDDPRFAAMLDRLDIPETLVLH
jgi:serine/threonine-protein kinase